MSTLWFVLRTLNVLLYCGIVSGLIMHWRYLGRQLADRLPGLRWGLVGLMASLTYGTVEIVFRSQPGGPRLIPLAVSLGVIFAACYLRTAQHVAARLAGRNTP